MGASKRHFQDDRSMADSGYDGMDSDYFYDLYCDANGQCYSDADSCL